MFTAALFTRAKLWRQPKYPSIDECLKKMWYLYAMEYYSVVKKMNEISPFATTWMDLKDIVLSEIRQRQFLYDFAHMSKKQNK